MENQPFQQKPISARASGQQRPPQRPTPPKNAAAAADSNTATATATASAATESKSEKEEKGCRLSQTQKCTADFIGIDHCNCADLYPLQQLPFYFQGRWRAGQCTNRSNDTGCQCSNRSCI